MLSKRYESTEVDRRTWLHVPSGTHWSTSSDTHQVAEIQIETSTKMYTPFLIGLNLRYGPYQINSIKIINFILFSALKLTKVEYAWKFFRQFDQIKKTMKSINVVFELTWSKEIGYYRF